MVQKRFGFPEGSVEVKLPQELGAAVEFVVGRMVSAKRWFGDNLGHVLPGLKKYSCTEIQSKLQRNCSVAEGF